MKDLARGIKLLRGCIEYSTSRNKSDVIKRLDNLEGCLAICKDTQGCGFIYTKEYKLYCEKFRQEMFRFLMSDDLENIIPINFSRCEEILEKMKPIGIVPYEYCMVSSKVRQYGDVIHCGNKINYIIKFLEGFKETLDVVDCVKDTGWRYGVLPPLTVLSEDLQEKKAYLLNNNRVEDIREFLRKYYSNVLSFYIGLGDYIRHIIYPPDTSYKYCFDRNNPGGYSQDERICSGEECEEL